MRDLDKMFSLSLMNFKYEDKQLFNILIIYRCKVDYF